MFNFFKKKQKPEQYVIAFCDENDITIKFGKSKEIFYSYESAKYLIFSKVSGWGQAIQNTIGDNAKIDNAWLIIEKKS